ncbi:glycosyltransferase family 39 protein [Sphingosinicella sp. CPCC 101087]|uniref:ArnT family glycosyltransferase n=1 Tax=Sphingosinicella sp. CPCC 101087 TaxID=2497754 RepID=UPI00101C348D|nr:glycosyltransferase family 39 protein [Sphingosinicella sp. CPCC 101087]
MTKPFDRFRTRASSFFGEHGPILGLLCLAAFLRLDGIAFGLPALNDPDEPLFMMLAFGMLERGSPDPQWFGHPGTVTLYCLALIMGAVAMLGIASGRFAGIEEFAQAVYLDPAIVILPARLFVAANGVACVYLTYLVGRRLWGRGAGLVAASVLAVNAVHIGWSQVIRTDVQASLFMLMCILAAIRIYRDGGVRSHVVAGLFAGLACATKWPAAIVFASPLAASLDRLRRGRGDRAGLGLLLLVPGMTVVAVAPFLLISYDVVLRDLAGEARPVHPGSTGYGFVGNLGWYLAGPLASSFGWAGLALALAGILGAALKSRPFLVAVCPAFIAFLLLISMQSLVWERWLVPLLPFLSLGLAWAAVRCARLMAAPWRWIASFTLALALAVPMLQASHGRSLERGNDTRQIASEWIRANVPPGSTILVEHAALDLMQGPWKIIFPLGSAGCVDAREALGNRISASEVEDRRRGTPVVDIAHVDPAKMQTCSADFAVLTRFDRYQAERQRFPSEFARYLSLTESGRLLWTVAPREGVAGGPEVRILALGRRAASPSRSSS